MNHRFTVLFVDRACQWNAHRTSLHAVLRIAAVGDSVFLHDAFESLIAVDLSRSGAC